MSLRFRRGFRDMRRNVFQRMFHSSSFHQSDGSGSRSPRPRRRWAHGFDYDYLYDYHYLYDYNYHYIVLFSILFIHSIILFIPSQQTLDTEGPAPSDYAQVNIHQQEEVSLVVFLFIWFLALLSRQSAVHLNQQIWCSQIFSKSIISQVSGSLIQRRKKYTQQKYNFDLWNMIVIISISFRDL